MEYIITDTGLDKIQEQDIGPCIQKAKTMGVKKFLCSPTPKTLQLLQDPKLDGLETFGIVPDFQQFVRDTSHYGTTGAAVRRILSMPFTKKLRLVKVSLSHLDLALKFQFELLMNLFLMAETSKIRKPTAVFLHHQITDLALSFDQPGLFKIFLEIVSGEFGAQAGISTLNLKRLTEVLEENQLEFPWILAPFNLKGYQMHPSAEACHKALKSIPSKVIALNWDLEGTLPENQAQDYLKTHSFAGATLDFSYFLGRAFSNPRMSLK